MVFFRFEVFGGVLKFAPILNRAVVCDIHLVVAVQKIHFGGRRAQRVSLGEKSSFSLEPKWSGNCILRDATPRCTAMSVAFRFDGAGGVLWASCFTDEERFDMYFNSIIFLVPSRISVKKLLESKVGRRRNFISPRSVSQ